MSIFSLFTSRKPDVSKYAFVDTEVGTKDHKIHDIGALRYDEATYHGTSKEELERFLLEGKVEFVCGHADLDSLIQEHPCALAYALALVNTTDHRSITPAWVLYNFPEVEHIIEILRHHRCTEGCAYCNQAFDVHHNLKRFFGYDSFRTYNGEPLQENAAKAAVEGKSLLAIFPTGGGKSLTFQLPALMAGHSVHGLTVVISPLQSLMKDQVDNLAQRGIADAVTINGLLDPITRSLAIERVMNGDATLLYIAPEMLRSKTIEKILMGRHIVRFVIDEAHCFSAWGQDFRVDYLYIGKFIKKYQERKLGNTKIPVSCFTATAKQKVVQDICDYFKKWLNIDLELFASSAERTNLQYSVIHVEKEEEKYPKLRSLIEAANCPTIVYVSRTKRTKELAFKLSRDGMKALPYNGKMDPDEKIVNQEAFMNGLVNIIVATSAFGMGVDKSDVGLVVHYDISDSLENYVQEAGRAGRDPHLSARCYVLYGDDDLNKHFILLNQTKLSISEIQQVWQAIKMLTKHRQRVYCSALEIARQAGWDDSTIDLETRVRTALSALEQSGYIERGNNVPHVYATGITVKNMDEARKRITESALFSEDETEKTVRIIKSLISQKNIAKAQDSEAESRIDYLADILGLSKKEIISAVERMRQEGILADTRDISAYLQETGDTQKKPMTLLEQYAQLERYIIEHIPEESLAITYKQFNDDAVNEGMTTSNEKRIRTLLYFLIVKGYIRKQQDDTRNVILTRQTDMDATLHRLERRIDICRFSIEWLYALTSTNNNDAKEGAVLFSIIEMTENYRSDKHIVDAANQFAIKIRQRMKHQPIVSMSQENGIVRVIKHPALWAKEEHCINFMYQPIAEDMISVQPKNSSTCVLTQTNEEALNMLSLLHRNGVKAKLVQSMDGMRFCNMAETRYFIKQIEQTAQATKSPIISEACWKNAKDKTYAKYTRSQSLEYLKRCLHIFEQSNQTKYKTDLKEFIFESSVEDFFDVSNAEVVVSTIHKAKGREFDNVYLLIDDSKKPTDEVLRSYYVAMTRAKHQLTIHTQGTFFDGIQADQKLYDPKEYEMPREITLQLTHKDIYLNFSKPYKREILALESGNSLGYHDFCLCIPSTGRDIAMLSSTKQNELKKWEAKGYKVTNAKVRFIVAWKPKDAPKDEKESAIPLIDLTMTRKS